MKNSTKAFAAGLLVALGAPLFAGTGTTASTRMAQAGGPGTDSVSRKVRHELVMLPYFTIFDNLGYKVDGNTVTLYGQVTKPVLKQDAQLAVERVEGITKVDNRIEVLPLSPFDNRIRWATARAVYGFPTLNRYAMGTEPSIHIIVKNGNVVLTGVVDSTADKNVAGIRANTVPGVFRVENDLQVASQRAS